MQQAIQEINQKYNENLQSIVFDGKVKRHGDKSHLWYIANEFNFKGQPSQTVTFGSWRDGSKHTINSLSTDVRTDKEYNKVYKKHTLEAQVQIESEKADKQKACKEKYAPIYKNAKTTDHEYLKYKNIRPFNSRTDLGGERLLIPVFDVDGFVGCQKIFKIDTKFEKRFSYGIKISASFCPLHTGWRTAEYLYVSEGFATSASIQMAFPNIPSICVFSAGNISKAISSIRAVNPDCKIIIGADRDLNKAGERGANEAKKAHANIVIVFPKFDIDNPDWTDFNDLHSFNSLDAVRSQLGVEADVFTEITCLGYSGSNYYYTSTSNNQIIELSASGHNKTAFFQLATQQYWTKKYATTDNEGKETVSYDNITSILMENCRNEGIFEPDVVRGRGVWEDGETYVINDGEKVLPEPKASKYHYQKEAKYDLRITTALSDEEMLEFTKLFSHIRFKNPKDYIYLMAWVVQAQIFPVLKWRFHLWLTGARGTGKSTVLKWMYRLVNNGFLSNNTTVSGVRQQLGNDARVAIIDEMEPTGKKGEDILELARASSTNGDFGTYRGSSGGNSIVNNTQTNFLFGSIQVDGMTPADKSRIFVVEMDDSKTQTVEEYGAMEEIVNYYAEIKDRLFTRCFQNIPTIKENQKTTQAYLRTVKRLESRLADQLSVVIACYFSFLSLGKIGQGDIDNILQAYNLLGGEYMEANQESDCDNCYGEIMQIQINKDCITVRHAIDRIESYTQELPDLVRDLGTHGIRYYKKEKEIFIAVKSTALSNKLKKFPDYKNILKRDTKRKPEIDTQRVESLGKAVRGIRLRCVD
jgi:putative DNA primase/helicase